MQTSLIVYDAVLFLQAFQHELLLFVAFWLVVGALDEWAVDIGWLWLKFTGRGRDMHIDRQQAAAPLSGRAAVMIATWQEADVIGHTVRHALARWRQRDFTLYIGCYRNDPATIAAVMTAGCGDPRLRIVVSASVGPTTKADCLNRVYAALETDERRYGWSYRTIVLHDAEDMVHPAELAVMDAALTDADFVQLPVSPELQPDSPWVGSHYADEFAESHGKAMIVRDALRAAIPAAGVGCGFSREMIARIARRRGTDGPFAAECLTEDYELGLLVRREGGTSRFVRVRDADGALVATRAFFPATLNQSVRQKARWIHGIAFQGWDRLGWDGSIADAWMTLRDRRGPLTAVVLACCYLLLVIQGVLHLAALGSVRVGMTISPFLEGLLSICVASFLWRCAFRCYFTTREYGLVEGLGALPRIFVANLVAILAGRRAVTGYIRTLCGGAVYWDKTRHDRHPAVADPALAVSQAVGP